MYRFDLETNEWDMLENSEKVVGRRKHCAIGEKMAGKSVVMCRNK